MTNKAAFLVAVAVCVLAGTAYASVTVPQSFAANVQLFFAGGGQSTSYYGTVYYDYLKLRRRVTVQDTLGRTIDALQRFDLEKQYELSDGRCSVSYMPRREADWFGWVASATFVGSFQVNQVTCNMYQLQAQGSTLSCCLLAGNNVPVLLRFQTGPTDTQYVFSHVNVAPQPEAIFQIPAQCPRGVSLSDKAENGRPIIKPAPQA